MLIVDGSLPEGDPSALPAPPPELAAARQAVRWILYSSGTTADPKGACHTDASLIASFTGLVRVLELTPDDRHAFVFPLTHVGGIGWLIASLLAGFAHVAVAIFEPKSVIPLLARHGVTQAGAGTVFHQAYLAAQREQPGTRLFPRVRAFPGGGAPKPPQLHYDVKNELGGVGIVSGYGLTECPIIAMNTVRNSDEQLANTEGRVNPPEAEIRVLRADGALAAPGEEGELCVRGPQLFRGYLDARLDAAAFDADGFFRTGDLGRLDADGCVVITGRTKDVIIRKGENISAKEVEDLLYTHPKVADVAVIGLPDPALGERCCAVVACKGDPLEFAEMVAFLRRRGPHRGRRFPSSSRSSRRCRATSRARSRSSSCATDSRSADSVAEASAQRIRLRVAASVRRSRVHPPYAYDRGSRRARAARSRARASAWASRARRTGAR